MKQFALLLLIVLIAIPAAANAEYVNGYTRKDGTYVQGYNRSDRNNTVQDKRPSSAGMSSEYVFQHVPAYTYKVYT